MMKIYCNITREYIGSGKSINGSGDLTDELTKVYDYDVVNNNGRNTWQRFVKR